MSSPPTRRDCPTDHSLMITTATSYSVEDSLRALLYAVDTPTTVSSSAQAPPVVAPVATAIDLDLLLSRDSIDVYDDNQQHQQHHQQQQHLQFSQRYPGAATAMGSLMSPFAHREQESFSRPEVTAVQAFLEEWQPDVEEEDDESIDASCASLLSASAGISGRSSQQQRLSRESGEGEKHNFVTPTARNAPKPKCIGTREREKEEAIRLRKEALQLELQLEQLRQCVQQVVRNNGEGTSPSSSLWKTLAERQRERLSLAGMENKRLKIAVRDQKRMAKSLHRILLNRVVHIAGMQPHLRTLMPWHELGESSDDQAVFERLMSSASTMYEHTDRVSRSLRAKTPPHGSYRKWDVKQGTTGPANSKNVYIELIDVEEMPFSVAQVNNLIHTLCNRIKSSTIRKGNETIQVTILMAKEQHGAPNSPRLMRMRNVFQNYVESSRSVFVYCSYLDQVSRDGKPLPGRILQERKWIILTDKAKLDPTTSASVAGPHKTVMQTYSTIAPLPNHPLSQNDETWNRDEIFRSEIPNWDWGYSLLSQKIENDLLQLAIAATAR